MGGKARKKIIKKEIQSQVNNFYVINLTIILPLISVYSTMNSEGCYLAECRCVALGHITLMKIRNLVHFADFSSLILGDLNRCLTITCSTVQASTWPSAHTGHSSKQYSGLVNRTLLITFIINEPSWHSTGLYVCNVLHFLNISWFSKI